MMLAIVYLICVTLIANAVAEEKVKPEDFQQWNDTCRKETGYSLTKPAEIQGMTKEAKCFIACLFEKEGSLKKDGTVDLDVAKNMVVGEKLMLIDAPRGKIVKHLEECVKEGVKVVAGDNCETAHNYLTCIEKKCTEDKKS